MDWPALLAALKPYGFRESTVFGFTALRLSDSLVVEWGLGGRPATVWRSRLSGEFDLPPLFSGSPEETVEWFKQREGVTT